MGSSVEGRGGEAAEGRGEVAARAVGKCWVLSAVEGTEGRGGCCVVRAQGCAAWCRAHSRRPWFSLILKFKRPAIRPKIG